MTTFQLTSTHGLRGRLCKLGRCMGRGAMVAVASMIAIVSAAEVSAQATDIEAVYVVVTQDTELRCDSGAAWYAIAELKAGQVLRADGVSFDWLRVEYPAGTAAVIKVGEADVQKAEQRVVLTRQTRLRAFNREAERIENCYKAVAQELLAPGLSLRYQGDVMNNRNEVAGYRVAAPAGAHGYVLESATRRASDAEVNAVLGALGGTTSTPTSTQVAAAPTTPSVADGTESAIPTTLLAPPIMNPTAVNDLNTTMPKSVQRSLDLIEELERAYKKVSQEPLERAELQPLIDAYAQLVDQARNTEAEMQVTRFAETRIELLNVRRELQKSAVALAALDEEAKRTTQEFKIIDAQVSASADYEVIGRLVPSAVYSGGQMPLLYRLQAVDGGSTRTVAYVAPDPALGLEGKLGTVVGVRGVRRIEGQSGPVGVPVIEPTLVTALKAASTASEPTESTTLVDDETQ